MIHNNDCESAKNKENSKQVRYFTCNECNHEWMSMKGKFIWLSWKKIASNKLFPSSHFLFHTAHSLILPHSLSRSLSVVWIISLRFPFQSSLKPLLFKSFQQQLKEGMVREKISGMRKKKKFCLSFATAAATVQNQLLLHAWKKTTQQGRKMKWKGKKLNLYSGYA